MAINTESTTSASAKPGLVYIDLISDPDIQALAESLSGFKYLASFANEQLSFVGVLLDSNNDASPDFLAIRQFDPARGYDGNNAATYLESVWALKSQTAATATELASMTFSLQRGSTTQASDVTVYLQPEGQDLVGFYIAPQAVAWDSVLASALVTRAEAVSADNSLKVEYSTDVRIIDEDLHNTGRGLFFNGESSPNTLFASGAGSNMIELSTSAASFNGAGIRATLSSTPVNTSPLALRVVLSNRSGVFSMDLTSGDITYNPGAKFSGSLVGAPTITEMGTSASAGTTAGGGSSAAAGTTLPSAGTPGSVAGTPMAYLWERSDPVAFDASQKGVVIGKADMGTYASTGFKTLQLSLNGAATTDVVELLLTHIAVMPVDATTGNYTQNWVNANATVTFSMAMDSANSATTGISFSKAVQIVAQDETDVPFLSISRVLKVVDEINFPNGRLIEFNGEAGPNVYKPTGARTDQLTFIDNDANYGGGVLRVGFVEGAHEKMRIGLSAGDGRVFNIDWNTNKIFYYRDAQYAGSNFTENGRSYRTFDPYKAGTEDNKVEIGYLDAMEKGFKGADLVIHFNENATVSIVRTVMASISVFVRDPLTGKQTNDWTGVDGTKLIKMSITDPQGNTASDTRPMVFFSTTENDTLGTVNNDTIKGGDGADTIDGLQGNDSLMGGGGNDVMRGSEGSDTLVGGNGSDTLNGGDWTDLYDLRETVRAKDLVIVEDDQSIEWADSITGFDVSSRTGETNDVLGLGTAHVSADTVSDVIGANGAAGRLAKHSIAKGIITFKDSAGRAVLINSSNRKDAQDYLQKNLGESGQSVAFAYDADQSGSADSIYVYQHSGGGDSSFVLISGLVNATLGTSAGFGVIELKDVAGPQPTGVSLAADGLSIMFNERLAEFDFTGVLVRKLSTQEILTVEPVIDAGDGKSVKLTFVGATVQADDGILVLPPAGTNAAKATDALGNVRYLFDGSDDGVAIGGAGNSTIDLSTLPGRISVMDWNGGNDRVTGNGLSNQMDVGDGDDTVFGGAGNDEISGGDGLDQLHGDAGDDTISGGIGDDVINGGDGADRLRGNQGDDTILAGAGNDVVDADQSPDDGDDFVDGGVGNDSLAGGGGNDTLDGGEGFDRAQYYYSSSRDWLITRDDQGTVTLARVGGTEVDELHNMEELGFSDMTSLLQVRFNAAQQSNWSNNINGTYFDDEIDADALKAERPDSKSARDWINAGEGNDFIRAGAGGDDVRGDAGNDTIDGGDSSLQALLTASPNTGTWELQNRAHYSGPSTRYSITQLTDASGDITGVQGGLYYEVKDLRGGSPDGTDVVFNIDELQFSDKGLRLSANVWINYKWDNMLPPGQQQTSQILGVNVTGTQFTESLGAISEAMASHFAGSDRIEGGAGDDILKGGAGADTLRGDKGNDFLDGGDNRILPLQPNEWDSHGSDGVDVAEFSGKQERYTVSRNQNGSFTVVDSKGAAGDGTDTLVNIEKIRFSDAQVNLEVVSRPNYKWTMNGQSTEINDVYTEGTAFDDVIDLTQGALSGYRDNINAGAGHDRIDTGAGRDWINPGEGDDTVDAGANGSSGNTWDDWDEVRYDAAQKRFIISKNSDGSFTVKDKLDAAFGGLGTDLLRNVERLSFDGNSISLVVEYNPNAWNNNINGTDFGDLINADELALQQARDSAGKAILVSVTDNNAKLAFNPGLNLQAGEKYIVQFGWIQTWDNNRFDVQSRWDPQTNTSVPYAIEMEADAQGVLRSSTETFGSIPSGGNTGIRILNAGASPEAPALTTQFLKISSSRDWIQSGSGDDTVYAGAGADTFRDGLGNDIYDGGANPAIDPQNYWNTWDKFDAVEFNGVLKRYRIEQVSYDSLGNDEQSRALKAYVDDKYAGQTQSLVIVRVTDRLPDVSGGDGVNYLVNVEQVRFSGNYNPIDLVSRYQIGMNGGRNDYQGSVLSEVLDARGHDNATPEAPQDQFTSPNDYLSGGAGNDSLLGGAGADTLVGGKGDDLLDGGVNSSETYGLDRAEFAGKQNRYSITFFREATEEEVANPALTKFNDKGLALLTLGGTDKSYVLSTVYDPAGFVVVQDRYPESLGGEGRDVLRNIEQLSFTGESDGQKRDVNLVVSDDGWRLRGTDFADRIESSLTDNKRMEGLGGHDFIRATGEGKNDLDGGQGNDTLDGGDNPEVDPQNPWNTWDKYDVAHYDSFDRKQFKITKHTDADGSITGVAGKAYFTVQHLIPDSLGGQGTDILYNIERLQFNGSDVALEVRIQQYDFGNPSASARYEGTAFADFIQSGAGNDWLSGALGDDIIDAGAGDDEVRFGDVVDRYDISIERDGAVVATFSKTDLFGQEFVYNADTDTVIVKDLLASAYGGEGTDRLSHVENLQFSGGYNLNLLNPTPPYSPEVSESLNRTEPNWGNPQGGHYEGGAGNDTLDASAAGATDDTLVGGGGNDTLIGGDNSQATENNWWSRGDVAGYWQAPRARFDIIAQGNGEFTVVDLASIKNLSENDFANGHLKSAVYTDPGRINTQVGFGVDQLQGIERLQFSDVSLDLVVQDSSWSYQSTRYVDGNPESYTVTTHNISGTFGNDMIRGSNGRDYIDPRAGDDTVDGGIETVQGNSWETSDEVRYEGSRARYEVTGVMVRVSGQPGQETYTLVTAAQVQADSTGVVAGLLVKDLLPFEVGGTGTDLLVNVEYVNFNDSRIAIKPDVGTWYDSYNKVTNMSFTGTGFDDLMVSADGNDNLRGEAGNDTLDGGAGGDYLEGGAGDDVIIGGDNGPRTDNGGAPTDTARFQGSFDRFIITRYTDASGKQWLKVQDTLPISEPGSQGMDLLSGVEGLSFDDRWVNVEVNTNSWTDWQGVVTTNHEGSILDDVIRGDAGDRAGRDSMRGNGGNDVLIGGGMGDDLSGGEGNDVLDGGANGTTSDSWRNNDSAQFSGDFARYNRSTLSVLGTSNSGSLAIDGRTVATVNNGALTFVVADLSTDIRSVLESAHAHLDLFDGQHATGLIVQDKVDSEFGGDGADVLFNIEGMSFRDRWLDYGLSVQTGDWNNDGKLDWANVRGSNGDDRITLDDVAQLGAQEIDKLLATNINVELREGDDVYIGGTGGEYITPGSGNDYVDGGGSTGTDQWGNQARDHVRFEGNYSRYTVLDIQLTQAQGIWTAKSVADPSLVYTVGSNGTPSTVSTSHARLVASEVAKAIDSLIGNAPAGATSINGWLVADRLPADLEGMGVDALVNVDSISFNDRWLPLSMQVWYNRAWTPEYNDTPWEQRPVVSAGVEGTSGNDTIGVGMAGTVMGYNFGGDDWLRGNEGDDRILGGAGADWIQGGAGDDYIDGGANGEIDAWGNVRGDTVSYDESFDFYTVKANADGTITVSDSRADGTGTDTLVNVEQLGFRDRWIRLGIDTWINRDTRSDKIYNINVNGSLLGDLIDVSKSVNNAVQHNLQGNEGNDTLTGGSGPDWIEGGQGDDLIVGGANGRDAWGNPGSDVARFNGAFARFTIQYSSDGSTWSATKPAAGASWVQVIDSLSAEDGGLGTDTLREIEALSFNDRYITLQMSRSAIDVDGDGKPDNIQTVGTNDSDTITGDGSNDQLIGAGGDDTLIGGGGADTLQGGAGNDVLDGGADGVNARGAVQPDVAEYLGKRSDYQISLNDAGDFVVTALSTDADSDGVDTLRNIEILQFADAQIRLTRDRVEWDTNGDGALDTVIVRGVDVSTVTDDLKPLDTDAANLSYQLYGGLGDDRLTGGSGNDLLVGGAGADTIEGAGGTDRARFLGNQSDYTVRYSINEGASWDAARTAGAWVQVTENDTGETDLVKNVEELAFNDKVVRLAISQVVSRTVDSNGDGIDDTQITLGTDTANTLTGAAQLLNTINADAGDDVVVGGHRDDLITLGAGNDTLDGGAGDDSALYAGNRSAYAVTQQQQFTFTLRANPGADTVAAFSMTVADQTVAVASGNLVDAANALARALEAAFNLTGSVVTGQTAGSTLQIETANTTVLSQGMKLKLDAGVFGITGLSSTVSTTDSTKTVWTLTLDRPLSSLPTGMVSVLRVGDALQVSSNGGVVKFQVSNAVFTADESSPSVSMAVDRWFEVASSAEGTDTLRQVEHLVFSDGQTDLSTTSSTKAVRVGDTFKLMDKITGTDFADLIRSTSKDEIFVGLDGADHLVIRDDSGSDQFYDFRAGAGGDVITLELGLNDADGLNAMNIKTASDAKALAVQQGNDVYLNLGAGNNLTLIGVKVDDLVLGNFEVVQTA